MWYKNAVVYCLDVETFMDSNGDGIGDFRGLIDRIDHFENLGVSCVWLQPFHPSPNRDDGYDVTDYYAVDPRLGTLGDFAEFSHALDERGIRLMIDLVVNHTSDQHPWFRAARADRTSRYRDYYVWSDTEPPDAESGVVFPGYQERTWTWCEEAQAYYFHRFFPHQPDLNIANPEVREEILRIMGCWLQLGASGFRIDAAPFLIERTDPAGRQCAPLYWFLREMHDFVGYRAGDAVMLAEANVEHERLLDYFGDGDRMHMLFNFPVNQPLFLALARREAAPLRRAWETLPPIPPRCQWANFLRGHDELDLGRLSDAERQEVFAAFAPDPDMQLYGRGLRRRLAAMFDGDMRRVEMASSLMFSLPGAPVIRYGDEIGMGDDLMLYARDAVRTPMQWSDARNAGFSSASAERLVRPAIGDGPFGAARVNVRRQIDEPDSLLNRVARLIRMRRSCPEIGLGEMRLIDSGHPAVFAHACMGRDRMVLALHNLGAEPCAVPVPDMAADQGMNELVADGRYEAGGEGIALAGYGYRWFRLGRPSDVKQGAAGLRDRPAGGA